MPEIYRQPAQPDRLKDFTEAAVAAGSVAFLYCACFWGFKSWVKDQVWEMQHGKCADPTGCNRPIDEYHHKIPENALKNRGISGKSTVENAVGLCFDHHKHKWDLLMFKGIFFPGVPLDQIDPDTYNGTIRPPRITNRKRRRR